MSKKNKLKGFNANNEYQRKDEEYENDWDKRSARKKATRSDRYGESCRKKHNYGIDENAEDDE